MVQPKRIQELAQLDLKEWGAVTTWEVSLTYQFSTKLTDQFQILKSFQGKGNGKLVTSGDTLEWQGSMDFAATYSGITDGGDQGTRSEQGSIAGTRAFGVTFSPTGVIAGLANSLITIPTKVTEGGTTTDGSQGIQVNFNTSGTGQPFTYPDAIGPIRFGATIGPSAESITISCTLTPVEVAPFRTLKVWINAFIPGNAFSTVPVPTGPYKGNTMIPGPLPGNDCYLTDQRSFNSSVHASSRIHAEAVIDLFTGNVVDGTFFALCSPTIEIDGQTGAVTCEKSADPSSIQIFCDLSVDVQGPGSPTASISFIGGVNNPCFAGSPSIQFSITAETKINADRKTGTANITGQISQYPAFELYMAPNSGATLTAFQLPPKDGTTPGSLLLPNIDLPAATCQLSW